VAEPSGPAPPGADAMKAEANRLIGYHAPISKALTAERTSLESRLIPVTAYIVVACAEAWYRYPDMIRVIDAAMPAEEIGRRARRPGCRVNTVYLWSIPNFYLLGRRIMAALDPGKDPVEPTWRVLDFWERAAMAFRGGDGTRQAWDAGGVVRPYGEEIIAALTDGAVPVADEARVGIKRFSATLVNYLFLLYFDTRVGAGNTGPYPLPDGRLLLVRDFYRLSRSPDFWWSDVAADVPYHHLVAGLVLDGVDVRITDFGTADTVPEDYLDRVVGFSLFTTDGGDGSLRPVPLDEVDGITASIRTAQSALYRKIAAMTDDEKIRCGAYVYFSFLRPYAELAGVADDLDWTVPRDTPEPLYQMFSMLRGENSGGAELDDPYYAPIP
jgi:hypothetical protein